ncbi:hypothetical protein [Pseudomonas sp.]|uniref:hypothetical protein n=1 Tax=Pseudomonas sp. TaxID=306 RepID=UPI00258D8DC8|nr:hypothetical protein [Pseudomonas sp.]
MTGSVNLALLSPQERKAMAVDLIARRLIHFRKTQGKEWKAWALVEIDKLTEPYRQPVKDRLNELMRPR